MLGTLNLHNTLTAHNLKVWPILNKYGFVIKNVLRIWNLKLQFIELNGILKLRYTE